MENEIRLYILESGRPIKKTYKKSIRRKRHIEYRKKKAALLRKSKLYRRSAKGKKAKLLYKKRVKRSSYRPIKRIYR